MASSAQKLCAGNLESLCAANSAIAKPKYERSKITAGIVHIGVGNFHRAHQCVFADDVLSLLGHETWGYKGIGLMPFDSKMQAVMKEQDCLYTLWQKGADRSEQVRVVGCHSDFILAPEDPELALSALSAVTTKIVTLTVTEKGYFVNLGTGQLDIHEPMVAHDIDLLKNTPATCTPFKTAAGYLVSAIRRRIAEGTGGFAILSCDNVQENGRKAQMAVLQLAEAVDDASVATWIREHVTFPNSMVDRITPATTDEAKAELTSKYGIIDAWPVVCETFLLWVVEDNFPAGRPQWDKTTSGKCLFVKDVVPYELMKLRLLNSVHQALSYPASLLGHELVHEAMADSRVYKFLEAYMAAAGRTVPIVEGLEKEEWNKSVLERFSNPAIRDTIFRLNEDATNRIAVALAPCLEADAVAGNESLSSAETSIVILPVACWVRCLLGHSVGELPAAAKLNRDDKGGAVAGPAAALWAAVQTHGQAGEPALKEARTEQPLEAALTFLREAFGEQVARETVGKALIEHLKLLQSTGGVEAALALAVAS